MTFSVKLQACFYDSFFLMFLYIYFWLLKILRISPNYNNIMSSSVV